MKYYYGFIKPCSDLNKRTRMDVARSCGKILKVFKCVDCYIPVGESFYLRESLCIIKTKKELIQCVKYFKNHKGKKK